RPDLGGKNRNELYRIADVMGYLTTVTTGEGKNARVINFKPSPTHHAKNSGALGGETGEVWVPDLKAHPTFLADLITQAKDHINTLIEAAIDLAGIVEHVTLVEFDTKLRADQVLQNKLNSLPNTTVIMNALSTEVLGDGSQVTGLKYKDRATDGEHVVELAGIFVQIGLLPN
ncbi:NAD-binding protein, partial [Acinetobacter baumannii]|uniref:NAD-binding protein n=1 Tax=Acinetobacter baumannii TaxID=470 RepID=UPI003ED9EE98